MIADRIKLPRWEKPMTNILQLVSNWVSDEANGCWIMILDNADDPTVFSNPPKGRSNSYRRLSCWSGIAVYFSPSNAKRIDPCDVCSKDAALKLTGSHHDTVKVRLMDENYTLLLFKKKIEGEFDKGDAIEVLRALDYMPLAISQAAAYISQRASWTTLAKYLNKFRKSVENRARKLFDGGGDEPTSAGGEGEGKGEEHPDTLTSVKNLAEVLQDQGIYKAAAEMNRQVVG